MPRRDDDDDDEVSDDGAEGGDDDLEEDGNKAYTMRCRMYENQFPECVSILLQPSSLSRESRMFHNSQRRNEGPSRSEANSLSSYRKQN